MALDFPNTPTVGQIFPSPAAPGVPQFVWDGAAWSGVGVATTIAAVRYDVAQGLSLAQKAQGRANIDALKKNYIGNGAMMVSQENGSTLATLSNTSTNYYVADKFAANIATSGALSYGQVASPTPGGSPNRIRLTVTTAEAALAAGHYACFDHRIEGFAVADLKLGTAAAKQFILQFGVKAPAGTYSVIFENSGPIISSGIRSYVAEYTIAAGEANTDVVKSVTVPGDVVATNWLTNNGIGLIVRWGMAAASNMQQAAGSWGTADVVGSPNQFNLLGTVGNVFELFDVGLYEGSAAPAFQVPDYATELRACQREFEQIAVPPNTGQLFQSKLLTATYYYDYWQFHVQKRVAPNFVLGPGASWTNATPTISPTIDGVMLNNGTTFFYLTGSAGSAGAKANARL
jgi:hypothetical protein